MIRTTGMCRLPFAGSWFSIRRGFTELRCGICCHFLRRASQSGAAPVSATYRRRLSFLPSLRHLPWPSDTWRGFSTGAARKRDCLQPA